MFGADSVVTPFPTSIGGQPPSPLSVQGLLRHLTKQPRHPYPPDYFPRKFASKEAAMATIAPVSTEIPVEQFALVVRSWTDQTIRVLTTAATVVVDISQCHLLPNIK